MEQKKREEEKGRKKRCSHTHTHNVLLKTSETTHTANILREEENEEDGAYYFPFTLLFYFHSTFMIMLSASMNISITA